MVGLEQIRGQLSPEGLEQNYPPDAVAEVLMSADFWHLFSAAELAKAADNASLEGQLLARFRFIYRHLGAVMVGN